MAESKVIKAFVDYGTKAKKTKRLILAQPVPEGTKGMFLPVNPDGAVGDFQPWMVAYLDSGVAPTGMSDDDAKHAIATALSTVLGGDEHE